MRVREAGRHMGGGYTSERMGERETETETERPKDRKTVCVREREQKEGTIVVLVCEESVNGKIASWKTQF